MTRGFESRLAGTAEAQWTARDLADLPVVAPPGAGDRLLVVAAHPDDESLGAGGLIAEAVAHGAEVRIVVASDGEASHPRSLSHSSMQLATIRRAELDRALGRLHPGLDVHLLGLPDGQLAHHLPELVAALASHAQGFSHVVTPWVGDRHPDHEACARAVQSVRGVRHWQYPIWAWHWDDPAAPALPWPSLRRVELTARARRAKRAAIAQHRSQHSPLSEAAGDEAILPPEFLTHFERDFEVFVIDPPATDQAYFERLYAVADDPWGLVGRFYERRKRALALAALPRPRFRRAFEPGCATGLLTAELVARCDDVVAWDSAVSAVRQARHRLSAVHGVEIVQASIPHQWPNGTFDLIVLSEVAYYCRDLAELVRPVHRSLAADGVLVAVHWRHPAPEHPHTAESVHEALGAGLQRIVSHVEDDFLLDVWDRSGVSVAAGEGIV